MCLLFSYFKKNMLLSFQFDGNTEFDIIYHPVYGAAACIMAKKLIRRGEELYVNYNYRIKWAPDWYKAAYERYTKETSQEKDGGQDQDSGQEQEEDGQDPDSGQEQDSGQPEE